MKKTIVSFIFFTSILLSACAHRREQKGQLESTEDSVKEYAIKESAKEVVAGDAGWAVEDLLLCGYKGEDAQLLVRDGYVSLYSRRTLCPVYVSWKLTKDRVDGDVQRCKTFFPDEEVDEAYRVQKYDYSGSGWSRGHMCPAADNKDSEVHMRESCLMTNICPQDMGLNNGRWNDLENKCRGWARNGDVLYIVCGPIFYPGQYRWIGDNVKIAVPDAFFKVVYIVKAKGEGRMIAYILPNSDVREKLDEFETSVNNVEDVTGIDFFPTLPDDVEELLEK